MAIIGHGPSLPKDVRMVIEVTRPQIQDKNKSYITNILIIHTYLNPLTSREAVLGGLEISPKHRRNPFLGGWVLLRRGDVLRSLGDKPGRGPIILTHHNPFLCVLREGNRREHGKDQPE
ncbi:hypothetical protein AVEN_130326-1 [Araneus ventricosus]|uniref:Uncharacterized protein n=1 Tax=Araneus ventricosus TaxID=182803 RepID=A0A4Y2BF93_ARAVE|nr:hypothetical protein AVEN_130326-1 [Araneus ventricosus]